MYRFNLHVAALAVVAGLGGCIPVHSSIRDIPAKPRDDCELNFIRFDILDGDLVKSHRVLGTISIESSDDVSADWTDALRKKVRRRVCPMGADTVALSTTLKLRGDYGSEALVYVLIRKPDVEIFGTEAHIASRTSALLTKASFDLNCPSEMLSIVPLGQVTRGVRGCEKQATYSYFRGTTIDPGFWIRDAH